jgi:hypothetical protein
MRDVREASLPVRMSHMSEMTFQFWPCTLRLASASASAARVDERKRAPRKAWP